MGLAKNFVRLWSPLFGILGAHLNGLDVVLSLIFDGARVEFYLPSGGTLCDLIKFSGVTSVTF